MCIKSQLLSCYMYENAKDLTINNIFQHFLDFAREFWNIHIEFFFLHMPDQGLFCQFGNWITTLRIRSSSSLLGTNLLNGSFACSQPDTFSCNTANGYHLISTSWNHDKNGKIHNWSNKQPLLYSLLWIEKQAVIVKWENIMYRSSMH